MASASIDPDLSVTRPGRPSRSRKSPLPTPNMAASSDAKRVSSTHCASVRTRVRSTPEIRTWIAATSSDAWQLGSLDGSGRGGVNADAGGASADTGSESGYDRDGAGSGGIDGDRGGVEGGSAANTTGVVGAVAHAEGALPAAAAAYGQASGGAGCAKRLGGCEAVRDCEAVRTRLGSEPSR